MEARSIAKYVRVSPRKAGQVCSLVRGKNVDEALAILKFTPRGAADIIAKVVKSAKANAEKVAKEEFKKRVEQEKMVGPETPIKTLGK